MSTNYFDAKNAGPIYQMDGELIAALGVVSGRITLETLKDSESFNLGHGHDANTSRKHFQEDHNRLIAEQILGRLLVNLMARCDGLSACIDRLSKRITELENKIA